MKIITRYLQTARDWLGCRLLGITGPLPEADNKLSRIAVGLSPNIVESLRRNAYKKGWSLDTYLDNTLLVTTRDGKPQMTIELAKETGQLQILELDLETRHALEQLVEAENRRAELITREALELYMVHGTDFRGGSSC